MKFISVILALIYLAMLANYPAIAITIGVTIVGFVLYMRWLNKSQIASESQFSGSAEEHKTVRKHELPLATELVVTELYHPGVNPSSLVEPVIIRDNLEFAVLDFETTGLHENAGDRVVQVGITLVNSEGKITDSWSQFVNPGKRIQNSAIHGITDQMVKNSPTFGQVAEKITALLAGRVIVAHNAKFDFRFLERELNLSGRFLDPRRTATFDTMTLSYLLGDLRNKKMETLAAAAGVDFEKLPGNGKHDAVTDTHATAGILEAYLLLDSDRVWQSVKWPLLNHEPVLFLTAAQYDDYRESISKWEELRQSVAALEVANLELPLGEEVYLSNFEFEELPAKQLLLRKRGFKIANSLTKSRTKLVVVKHFETMTKTLPRANKWGIPIITWEQFLEATANK